MGTYGWGSSSIATAVVRAVADEEGCEPEELTTLYDVIDPDALEAFFEADSGGAASERRIVFTYAGYEVTVSGDDEVDVAVAKEPALAD